MSDQCFKSWQWLYPPCLSPSRGLPPITQEDFQHVIGARLGDEHFYRGDCVLLRAEGTGPPWVAIIRAFTTDEFGRMAADFVWFSNEREVRNTARKRTDFLPVGFIYMISFLRR